MNKKFGTCECGKYSSLNSKGECPDCVYLKNHGESRSEAYSRKESLKPKKVYTLNRSSLKRANKPLKRKAMNKTPTEKRILQVALDEMTYEEVFMSQPNCCEECGAPLNDEFRNEEGRVIFKGQYSHILTKGAYPEFRNDKRNFNRLCSDHHHQWEFGEREEMKIFNSNGVIILKLLNHE